ncbi:glycine-rich cell wall structural protein 1.8-like [Cryptomeria japonica]|uniref:glycine-rich cell wall structural protein 1.8-like n=1 Tax=Cryptomeria japonica TaxID=3369 RepID=UPI0027DA8D2A|nr:glycine-rich cell wall structural protein 1.8-like [Cryptomeria japonica]
MRNHLMAEVGPVDECYTKESESVVGRGCQSSAATEAVGTGAGGRSSDDVVDDYAYGFYPWASGRLPRGGRGSSWFSGRRREQAAGVTEGGRRCELSGLVVGAERANRGSKAASEVPMRPVGRSAAAGSGLGNRRDILRGGVRNKAATSLGSGTARGRDGRTGRPVLIAAGPDLQHVRHAAGVDSSGPVDGAGSLHGRGGGGSGGLAGGPAMAGGPLVAAAGGAARRSVDGMLWRRWEVPPRAAQL